jgi:hypothetical protein
MLVKLQSQTLESISLFFSKTIYLGARLGSVDGN